MVEKEPICENKLQGTHNFHSLKRFIDKQVRNSKNHEDHQQRDVKYCVQLAIKETLICAQNKN